MIGVTESSNCIGCLPVLMALLDGVTCMSLVGVVFSGCVRVLVVVAFSIISGVGTEGFCDTCVLPFEAGVIDSKSPLLSYCLISRAGSGMLSSIHFWHCW